QGGRKEGGMSVTKEDVDRLKAESLIARDEFSNAWEERPRAAVALADQVKHLRDRGLMPSREEMEALYRFLAPYEAAERVCEAKRAARNEAIDRYHDASDAWHDAEDNRG